ASCSTGTCRGVCDRTCRRLFRSSALVMPWMRSCNGRCWAKSCSSWIKVCAARARRAAPRGSGVDFQYSAKSRDYLGRLGVFMDEHIYPNEERFEAQHRAGDRWQEPPLLQELKQRARAAGLWNLFLPDSPHGAGLTNLEYAPLCELMGRV